MLHEADIGTEQNRPAVGRERMHLGDSRGDQLRRECRLVSYRGPQCEGGNQRSMLLLETRQLVRRIYETRNLRNGMCQHVHTTSERVVQPDPVLRMSEYRYAVTMGHFDGSLDHIHRHIDDRCIAHESASEEFQSLHVHSRIAARKGFRLLWRGGLGELHLCGEINRVSMQGKNGTRQ